MAPFEFAAEVRFAELVAGALVVLLADSDVAVGSDVGVEDLKAAGEKRYWKMAKIPSAEGKRAGRKGMVGWSHGEGTWYGVWVWVG